jgi:hypothetical protein
MEKKEICILFLINIKDDLILNMIKNISTIENINKCKIVFWHNSLIGNKFFSIDKYGKNHDLCAKIIKENLINLSNAEYILNEPSKNLYIDRYNALEYCFKFSDNVIYVEDDIIMSTQFVNFFSYFINNNYIGLESNKSQFIAGESIFFDSQNKHVDDNYIDKMKKIVEENELHKYYTYFDFVPSSCLLYNFNIWNKIKETCNCSLGMDFLIDFCKKNNYKTLFPIVALCQDIGMLHDYGYSVRIIGKEKICQIKNSYIINDYYDEKYMLYDKNKDELYNISVLLNDKDINL